MVVSRLAYPGWHCAGEGMTLKSYTGRETLVKNLAGWYTAYGD